MRPEVSFHKDFETDLEAVIDFLISRSISLAGRFADEFERAVARVLAFPNSGTPIGGHLYSVLVGRGPYSIIYDFDSETSALIFLAVAHARRRPGYWKDRL